MLNAVSRSIRSNRYSLGGTWKFELRKDNPLFAPGSVQLGPIRASSQQMDMLIPREHYFCPPTLPYPLMATLGGFDEIYWRPAEQPEGEPYWWEADLGEFLAVHDVHIRWTCPENVGFRVELSNDGSVWSLLGAHPSGGEASYEAGVAGGAVPLTRYVRVMFASGGFSGVKEIRIFHQKGNGSSVRWNHRLRSDEFPDLSRYAADFADPAFDDTAWADIVVPGYWEKQRFSEPTYYGPDDWAGCYRRAFIVPERWDGRVVKLYFEGVNNGAHVWVNGQFLGYHESGFTPFEYDVTRCLRRGEENVIAVRATKWTITSDYDTNDHFFLGGIWRDVYLYALPAAHIADYCWETDFTESFAGALLTVRLEAEVRDANGAVALEVRGRLIDPDGREMDVGNFRGIGTVLPGKRAPLQLSGYVEQPSLWSDEAPALYTLVLALHRAGESSPAHEITTRIGFRSLYARNGVLYLNGVPAKMSGVLTARANPMSSEEPTDTMLQREIRLLKEGNINSIRSHTTPIEDEFLDLCDECGILVIPDIPCVWIDQHTFTALTDGLLLRAEETLRMHRNHPSVVMWCVGNEVTGATTPESVMGRACRYLRERDPTRIVINSCTVADPLLGTEVTDWHYWVNEFLGRHEQYKAGKHIDRFPQWGKVPDTDRYPMLFTEFNAVISNVTLLWDLTRIEAWGRSLVKEWEAIYRTSFIGGGHVCCWEDGNVNGDPGKQQWGLLDQYRQPKTMYWQVRNAFSPVRAVWAQANDSGIRIRLDNRFAFTSLERVAMEWRLSEDGSDTASGTLAPAIGPRQSGCVDLPAKVSASVRKPRLTLRFRYASGLEFYSAELPLTGENAAATWQSVLSEAIAGAKTSEAGTAETGATRASSPTLRLEGAGIAIGGWAGFARAEPYAVPGEVKLSAARSGGSRIEASLHAVHDGYTLTGHLSAAAETGRLLFEYAYTADQGWARRRQPGHLESGLDFDMNEAIRRVVWKRDALWTSYPEWYPDGPRGACTLAEWLGSGGKRGLDVLLLETADGGYAVRRLDGKPFDVHTVYDEAGNAKFGLTDYLHEQNFLGYYGTDLTWPIDFGHADERRLAKGERFSVTFEIVRLDRGQTEALRDVLA